MNTEKLIQAVKSLSDAFAQIRDAMKKIADAFQSIFQTSMEERKRGSISPKKYGMRQIKHPYNPRKSVTSYGYIPQVRRYLSYQRRNF